MHRIMVSARLLIYTLNVCVVHYVCGVTQGLKSCTRLCRSLSSSFSSLMREEMYSNEDGLANDSLSNGDTSVNLNKQTALAPQASKQM